MNEADIVQRTRDEEHLKILSIVYYVLGGFNLAWAFFPLIYTFMGVALIALPMESDEEIGRFVGVAIIAVCVLASLAILTVGSLKLYAGYCLSKRKKRGLCLVVAAISLIGIPVGTLLGILTFIVLNRPSVVQLFEGKKDAAPST